VVLFTVPAASQIDPYDTDLRRWAPQSLLAVPSRGLPKVARLTVQGHGNAIAGAPFFIVLAGQDVGYHHLDREDRSFAVTCCARVVRPPSETHARPA
jgi:hypothetical protein